MAFLWGFIMYFICHTIAASFETSISRYLKEKHSDNADYYAMKQHTKNIGICIAIYIGLLALGMLVYPFAKHRMAILIGNCIGFITGSIHFKVNKKISILEKKIDTIKRGENKNPEDSSSKYSYHNQSEFLHQCGYEKNCRESSAKSQSYGELISDYFKKEKGIKATNTNLSEKEEIMAFYQNWTLAITVDENKELIKIYTPFINVPPSKQEEIHEILNAWNLNSVYVKFYYYVSELGPFVYVTRAVPLLDRKSIGKYVFSIADDFVKTIDDFFKILIEDIE